ncbi:hypothetical protein Leryth_015834 [Lithospermum erythrorhizon]|nr:hypothetical protein Leryth_015834 [Lithospermum erythrorhizon]
MALRSSSNYLKSMVHRLRGSASYATSTSPKMKGFASASNFIKSPDFKARVKKGDFVPVSVALGMIMLSTSFGIHTAMQQLKRSPNVYVKKSRRETIPEVVEPEQVMEDSEKFIKKSLFRKVAHIQDPKKFETIPNPIRGNILDKKNHVESLKDIGFDPKLH